MKATAKNSYRDANLLVGRVGLLEVVLGDDLLSSLDWGTNIGVLLSDNSCVSCREILAFTLAEAVGV